MKARQPGFRRVRGCCRSSILTSWDWRRAISCRDAVSPARGISDFHFAVARLAASLIFLLVSVMQLDAQEDGVARNYADEGHLRVQVVPEDLALNVDGQTKSEALALYFKGLMYEDALNISEARKCFEGVIKLDPGNVELTLETANLGAADGKFDESLAILEESLLRNPDNPKAYLNLSHFCDTFSTSRKEFGESAVTYGRNAFERFPYNPEVCEHYTGVLVARERFDEAKAALEKTMSISSVNPYFWLQMGRIARNVHPIEKSEENKAVVNGVFEKAMRAAPGNGDVVLRVGDYFSRTRQYERARDLYEEIVQKNPQKLEVRERLVRVYKLTGEMDKALAALDELVKINPHREKTQELLAEMLDQKGNLEDAITHMEELLKLRDGKEEEYIRLFDLLLEANRVNEALKVGKKAQRLFPASLTISLNVSRALTLNGQFGEALEQWADTEKLALEQGEKLTKEFYFSYGAAADKAGKTDEAADHLQKAIRLATENDDDESAAESLNYLGYMWLEKGINIEEAGLLIRRALQFVPENGAFIDSLGWFYFKKGDFARALEQLLKAAELCEEPDSVIFDHIAEAYASLGKKEEASEYLRKAIQLDPENAVLKNRLAEMGGGDQEAS